MLTTLAAEPREYREQVKLKFNQIQIDFPLLLRHSLRVKKVLRANSRMLRTETIARAVFIRSNAASFIKFSAFSMRRLFEGDFYFEITFLKSPTTVNCWKLFVNIM